MKMMVGDANDVNRIMTYKIDLGHDFTHAEVPWQRDNVHWSDLEDWWTLGYFKGDKWEPESMGEEDCDDLTVGSLELPLRDASRKPDVLGSVYAVEAANRGPNLCMRAKQDRDYTNRILGADHHISVSYIPQRIVNSPGISADRHRQPILTTRT